jgi:hypothetical protein
MVGQQRTQGGHELLRIDGLGKVAVKTGGQRLFSVTCHSVGRDRHQGNVEQQRVSLDRARHVVAVKARHLHVAHDQVGLMAPYHVQAFFAVACHQHLVLPGAQQVGQQFQVDGVVVDDQDA